MSSLERLRAAEYGIAHACGRQRTLRPTRNRHGSRPDGPWASAVLVAAGLPASPTTAKRATLTLLRSTAAVEVHLHAGGCADP